MPKATLSDLYRRGKDVTIKDPALGLEIKAYIKKLNPIEAKEARDKGNAARARVLMKKRDQESDEYLAAWAEASDASRETMIEELTVIDIMKRRQQVEEEVKHEDEWNEEDYLDGLLQSWKDELEMIFIDPTIDEDDKVEANRVKAELERFADQVDKIMDSEIAAIRRPFEEMDEELLRQKYVDRIFEQAGYSAWTEAFYHARVFHSTRHPDNHNKKMFGSFREVQELEPEVTAAIIKAYAEIEVDPIEVKDSEQTPTS